MTLILALVTPRYAIHVSDRQLTDGRTGRPLVTPAAKTVVVPQAQFMVSYTGLASVAPRMTTEEWLMRTIWSLRDSEDFLGDLARASAAAFRSIALPPRLKRHGFVVSGWIGSGRIETDVPLPAAMAGGAYHAFVSNILDFEAGVEVSDAREEFDHRTRPLYAGEPFSVFTAGCPLTVAETDELDANIAAAMRARGGGVRAAAVAMLRTLDIVAARSQTVGGGAFVCAIPREYVLDEQPNRGPTMTVLGLRWGLPESGVPTFLHLPDRPTRTVESPGVMADAFAGRAEVTVMTGDVPGRAGVPSVPEAGEVRLRLVALRSSDEIGELFGDPAGPSSAVPT